MKTTMRNQALPKPFLKWVGGKGQLLDELSTRVKLAGAFKRYHEPFVGGGALFFHLYRNKWLGKKLAYLSDNNIRLIDAYAGVKTCVEEVIALLLRHAALHSPEYYYDIRANVPDTLAERAARIIYLNKTCFNGLYRENSKGEFNVPIGRYKNPMICDENNLRAVAESMKKAQVEQRHFSAVLDVAEQGDLVYFDPPYHPVSATASFTGYDKGGFTAEAQRQLAEVFAKLTRRKVKAILSNSDTAFIRDLYQDKGYVIESVSAVRLVNSRSDRRGAVQEVIIRNY